MRKVLIFALILVCSTLALAINTSNCPEGIVSYYTLDEGSGAIANDYYDNNDGTVANAIWTSSGKVNGALEFDGYNDYVDLGANPFGTLRNASIEMWFENNNDSYASPHEDVLFSVYQDLENRFKINLDFTNGKLFWSYKYGTVWTFAIDSSKGWADGDWYHVVATCGDGGAKLYLNGVLQGSDPSTLCFDSIIATSTRIGNFYQGASYYGTSWNGTIDEVAVYNRELNSSEILQHYLDGNNNNKGYCEAAAESDIIPEVKGNKTLQIFVILIIALLIGSALLKKQ